MPRGVILDIDGTLLLSNASHARAWVEAFAEAGYDIPYEKVLPLIGMGGGKLLDTLVPGMSDGEGPGKAVSERRREIFLQRYAPTLTPSPGARDLVLRLKDEGMHLIVGTSSNQEEVETLLQAARVADVLPEVTTSSDVSQAKPAPDIVHSALDKLGLPADQVLMLGDTPYDVESASKARVGIIAVRCGGWDDEHLKGAVAIYDDPADLLRHFDESPLVGVHAQAD